MTKQEAINILGSRANWELRNMKKALSFCELLNTPEENKRLQACKILLKNGGFKMDKIQIVFANGLRFYKGKHGKLYITKTAAEKSFKE